MNSDKPQAVIKSPIGYIKIWSNEKAVTGLDIVKTGKPSEAQGAVATKAAAELAKYFEGGLKRFSVPVEVDGTEFQRAVWAELAKLSFGSTASYREIAAAVGKPAAARAVGAAVGANPVPILLGCHRVLGSGGKLTGYSAGAGVSTKQWLLTHEGITSARL